MIKFPGLSAQVVAPPCVIRLATGEDLPALRFVDPLMRADRGRAHLVQSSIEKRHCWLAADNDEVLGFILLGDFLGQGFVPLLLVAAADRRRGIGTRLLRKAERQCSQPKLFVSCNRSNLPAQELFESCGFEASGQVANLEEGDDELFYFKRSHALNHCGHAAFGGAFALKEARSLGVGRHKRCCSSPLRRLRLKNGIKPTKCSEERPNDDHTVSRN
jgi:ribosomal protein S18 acetylase RimI-like enzyme